MLKALLATYITACVITIGYSVRYIRQKYETFGDCDCCPHGPATSGEGDSTDRKV
jgi:hypothetical protein